MKLPAKVAREIKDNISVDLAAYIYPDGILVKQKVRLKHKGRPTDARKDIWYACPGKIRFSVNQKFDATMPTRYVVHDPLALLDGVDAMDMWWENYSERDVKAGVIVRDSLTLITASGARHRMEFLGYVADCSMDLHGTHNGVYTVQKDTPGFEETIETLRSDKDTLEIVEFPSKD